jgi:hypothetical protein
VRGRWRNTKEAETETETGALISTLVRMMPDSSFAAILNRLGKRTIGGSPSGRVQPFRNDHHLLGIARGSVQTVGS